MNRNEKQALLAKTARSFAQHIETEYANLGFSDRAFDPMGIATNVIGTIIARAGLGNSRKLRGKDTESALCIALGMKEDDKLPLRVLIKMGEVFIAGKVCGWKDVADALVVFADVLESTRCGRPVGRPPKV